MNLRRHLGPQSEVDPLDGRSPQYRLVLFIDTRLLPPKNVGSSTHGMSAASCQPTRLERHDTPSALRAPFGKAQRGQLGKGLERDSRSKPLAFGKAFAKLNSPK